MKNNKKQLMTMTVVFSIITAIYLAIYSKIAFSKYSETSTKVVLTIILIVLILLVTLCLIFGLMPNKNNLQEEKTSSADKKNPLFSILIGLGVAAIVSVGLLVIFFTAISG